MKKALIFLLLVVPVLAQLDWTITELKCGNSNLDKYELCDKGATDTYCDDLGTLLKIDPVCDAAHCTCLPRVNTAYCGNNIREGVELCDGTAEDFCPEFGNITGIKLRCNVKTCGCIINETIPSDYNPVTIEQLENKAATESVCGNKKVERAEECDPPNTLCKTILGDPGVCTSKCECIEPSKLDQPKKMEPIAPIKKIETVKATINTTENKTQTTETNINTENTTEITTANETTEKPGFFGRIWNWITGLFK